MSCRRKEKNIFFTRRLERQIFLSFSRYFSLLLAVALARDGRGWDRDQQSLLSNVLIRRGGEGGGGGGHTCGQAGDCHVKDCCGDIRKRKEGNRRGRWAKAESPAEVAADAYRRVSSRSQDGKYVCRASVSFPPIEIRIPPSLSRTHACHMRP